MNIFGKTRRLLLGGSMLCAGAMLSGFGFERASAKIRLNGNILLDNVPNYTKGLTEAVKFPLISAIQGRRSRRFALGAEIPDGPFKYKSKHNPKPLTELQQLCLLTSMAGNTGWSNLIPYNSNYLPHIPNYASAAGGRAFPSAAGFHTTEIFFTDDNGSYFLPTKDMLGHTAVNDNGEMDLNDYLNLHKNRIRKISNKRLHIPHEPAHMESHNHWCANVPGSTLIIPVADLAQHHILNLCYLVQNGIGLFDDINGREIPGLNKFSFIDKDNVFPISLAEQISLTEVTVETTTACYAGMLMLQALGLGGWMYEGINPVSILGASGDPRVPGLGFSYHTDDRWILPNITGLEGVFEGTCPPHYPNMRAAVEAVIHRKYGSGGPFNKNTGGPYINNAKIRSSGSATNQEFIECVTTMAQYTYDTFGRCPGNAPSMFTMMYLQAHHLDLEFYDKYFSNGAYLNTHRDQAENW